MGRAKKTVTKKKPASKKVASKKIIEKPSPVKAAETETTPPVVEEPAEETGGDTLVRGEDVVVLELPVEGQLGLNTFDDVQGKSVEMVLTRGINKVPRTLFEAFENDEFFNKNIVGTGVVVVISKPGKSLDEVDI